MSKSIVESFLKKIQRQDESIFPMDSPHTGKAFNWKKKTGKFKTLPQIETSEGVDPSFQDKKRIMIDFDGVIHSYDKGFQNGEVYGNVIEGSKEAVEHFKSKGYEIVIFTTRASKEHNIDPKSKELISNVESWLNKNGIYFDDITADKLGAVAYIDDKAIRFESNWDDIIEKINEIEIKEN